MANNMTIGAKLALDGEKEYKSAIADINKTLAVLASEGKKTAAQFGENKNSLKALTEQTENYQKQADTQRDKVNATREALENAKKAYGENSDKVKDWTIKLNRAEEQLAKTESAINKSKEAMKQAAKQESGINKLRNAIGELKEKADKVAAPLSKAGDAAKKLGSVGLKAIGGTAKGAAIGVAAIGAAAAAAGKQFWDAAQAAAGAGDAIDEASQRMGVNAETFQKLEYAAKMSGVEVATLEVAAKTLKKSGQNLSLDEAIKQIANMENESARTAKAIELFGSKAAYSMGPMLAQGADGVEGLMNKAKEMGIVMSNDAVSASAKFNDSLDNLTATFGAVKNNISAELLPGITMFMDGLTGMLSGDEGAGKLIEQGANDMVESLGEMLSRFSEILGTLIETVVEVAPEIVISLADGIIDNLDSLIESALEMISALAEGLLTDENIEKIMSAAVNLMIGLAGFLSDNTGLVVDAAFEIIDGLIDGLLEDDNLEKLVGSSLNIVTSIAGGLIEHIPSLLKAVPDLCEALFNAIKNYDWAGVAKKIYNSIKDGIKNIFTGDDSDGSHAGGIGYVPYDGYVAQLHKGEKVLTAAQNVTVSDNTSNKDYELLNKKLDAVLAQQSQGNVNVNISGSAAAVVRALDISVVRENKRKTAFA